MAIRIIRYNAFYYHSTSIKIYRSFVIILLLFMLGCSDSKKVGKDADVDIDVIGNVGFKSVSANNGISVKLIPVENKSYTLQVNIANHTDTLDYYLNSKTEQQSIPKIYFGTDYVFLLTGSSSYRYITLSYWNKRFDKIITHKYITGIDVSSDIDGAIFFKDGYYYLYDIDEHELHCVRSNSNMDSFSEATLFNGDSILIEGGCEKEKYKRQDFSIKENLLASIISK